ncbi:MAG: hypothetical protein HY954_02885 [Deltaproteobacteria bacterium]|nr:hypothetical protein [Deltaproteobacteria bacterium]
MPSFKKIFFLFSVLLSLSGCALKGPEGVVRAYFTGDSKGEKLSPETYAGKIAPLVEWPSEHVWDRAFIIDGTKILRSRMISENEASVEVRYHVVGILSTYGILSYDFHEIVDFTVVEDKGKWKIRRPAIPPHLWPRSVIRHLEKALEMEPDPGKAVFIKHDIDTLKCLEK